jgi:hypothetical protein
MHFRDHPLLKHGKINTWPPAWVNTRNDGKKVLRGEVGVLRDVIANTFTGKRCFLVIEVEDESYVGALLIDDPALSACEEILDRSYRPADQGNREFRHQREPLIASL